MFNSKQGDPSIVGYVDSDYADEISDKSSKAWYVFTLAGGPIC